MKKIISLILCIFITKPLWAEQDLTPVSCNESASSISLQYGQHIECKLDTSSELDIFTFNGKAGEKVHIYTTDLTSNYHGLTASLYDKDNFKIGYSLSSINPILPTSGTYRIEVKSSSRTLYRLSIDCLLCDSDPENILIYDQPHTDKVDYINDNDYFLFYGHAGTTVEIKRSFENVSYFSLPMSLHDTSGIKLASIGSSLEWDLLETGFYTIWVDGTSEGQYEFGVHCISGDCPSGMGSDIHSIEFKNGMAYCMENPSICISADNPLYNEETQVLIVPNISVNSSSNQPRYNVELKYIPNSQPMKFQVQSLTERE